MLITRGDKAVISQAKDFRFSGDYVRIDSWVIVGTRTLEMPDVRGCSSRSPFPVRRRFHRREWRKEARLGRSSAEETLTQWRWASRAHVCHHGTAGLPVSYPLAGANRAEPPPSARWYATTVTTYYSTLSSSPLPLPLPPLLPWPRLHQPSSRVRLDSATQPVNEHVTRRGCKALIVSARLWTVLPRGIPAYCVYSRIIYTGCV